MSTSVREASSPLLRLGDVHANVATQPVLRGVSLDIPAGELLAVLGHNGAGKTTLLRTIIGLNPLASGEVELDTEPIGGWSTASIVRKGVSLVPQQRGTFENLSVEDNLAFTAVKGGQVDLDTVFGLFPILEERKRQLAGTLSGGQRQMLAISMGLLANPRVLLLDEPSVGLQPNLVEHVMAVTQRANVEYGMTVLLVEQNINKVLQVARRVVVLNQGRVVLDKPATETDAAQIWKLL